MNATKWVKSFFILFSLSVFFFILSIILIDPLKVLHKPYFFKDRFNSNMRLQNAGIIKNYEFDSIILGTSMLENTSAVEASNLLGGNFANISMSASDYYERNIVLSYALKNKEIKKVIYSLDSNYYNLEKKYINYPLETYIYLYDENIFNDVKVYFNNSYFKYITTLLKKSSKKTLEYPNAWFDDKSNSVRFGGLDNWLKAENSNKIKDVFSSVVSTSEKIKKNEKIVQNDTEDLKQKIKYYIDDTIIKNVIRYPNTEFIMFFPPYSRLNYALWAQCDISKYEIHKEIIRYMTEKSNQYKNLKIYGFENDDFLDDIANYKDLTHYHQSINSLMLSNFKNNIGLLTSENIESYIKISETKALNYNVGYIADRMSEYLKNKK